jgi:hypothetical protein
MAGAPGSGTAPARSAAIQTAAISAFSGPKNEELWPLKYSPGTSSGRICR